MSLRGTLSVVIMLISTFAFGQEELCRSYTDSVKGEVFTKVDVMPEYPGGMAAMSAHYSRVAYNLGLEAQSFIDSIGVYEVYIQFIVEVDGNLSSRKILNAENEELALSVSAALQTMPNWNPGVCKGEKVPVRMTFPITFRRK